MSQERDKPVLGIRNGGWGMPSRLKRSVMQIDKATTRQLQWQEAAKTTNNKNELETQETPLVSDNPSSETR